MILELIAEAVQNGASQHAACELLGLSQRTVKRWRRQGSGDDGRKRRTDTPANKLGEKERQEVLDVANSPDFRDLSPWQIVPLLADQSRYIASESTFYRILRQAGQQHHRQSSRAPLPKPAELVATGPEQIWSWDITFMGAAVRGQFWYLYMFLDVWSRKIVGWEVYERESMELSSALFEGLAGELKAGGQGLRLHSDNGAAMRGCTMKATLENLGVMQSLSRPGVSDDNPYSESLFRTLKYRPGYPGAFATLEDARTWVSEFAQWYNFEHQHSGIGYVTPQSRHSGEDVEVLRKRRVVYEAVQQSHPARFGSRVRSWTAPRTVVMHRKGVAGAASPAEREATEAPRSVEG